jgi:CxxC-x17-CxxC domain-containing protein
MEDQVEVMVEFFDAQDNPSLVDKALVCRDCGTTFVFTSDEQLFYREKGLSHEPQRCSVCRANRRRERNGQPSREMYPVVCAECGIQTMVPFLPRQDRPVYCSTCFDRVRATAPPGWHSWPGGRFAAAVAEFYRQSDEITH